MSAEQILQEKEAVPRKETVVRADVSLAPIRSTAQPASTAAPDDHSVAASDRPISPLDLLRDVELSVRIELGRSRMCLEDILKLDEGSVVELDRLAGDPVDVLVNDRLVARGEVVVVNENFAVRVTEILAAAKPEGV